MTTRGRTDRCTSLRRIALSLLRRVAPAPAAVPAVGHLLDCRRAPRQLQERRGGCLLLLDHRLQEVAVLLDQPERLLRIDHWQASILGLESFLVRVRGIAI